MAPPDPADGGQLIAGRYALDEVLGRGGAGTVWRGRDTVLDRPVAVKAFRVALEAAAGVDGSVDADRVMREARLAARLQHPGAVGVFDVVDHDGRLHLVMELVEAPDLATLVARDGPLAPRRAAAIGLQLLDVLQAAHRLGVIHRDVKPSNVLVTAGDRVRLTDFGTAILAGDDRLTATDVVVGSPAYMAPEQVVTRDVTPAADLWSLGATLYHAVEGLPPYSGPSALATVHAVVHERPRPAAQAGALGPVLDGLLVHDPEARTGPGALRGALQRVADGATPHADDADDDDRTAALPAVATREPAGRDERTEGPGRRLVLVAGAAALLIGLAVVAAGALRGAEDDRIAGTSQATEVVAPSDPAAAELTPTTPSATTPATTAPSAVPTPSADLPDPTPTPDADARGAGGDGDEADDDEDEDEGDDEDRGDEDDTAPAAVPADWVAYSPEAGPYRLSHPPSWQVRPIEGTNRTDIADPSSGAYLRLDWTDDPAPDPLADWQAYEPQFAAGKDGYERIRMESTTFDGEPAALWEYRYREGGQVLRAYNLNVSGQRYGYALNFQTTEARWAEQEPLFSGFTASYDIIG